MNKNVVKSSELVSLKNNLKKDKTETDISNIIIEKIMDLDNFQKYKFDCEMIKYVCNLIEHLVKKDFKIDKKQLAINIISKVFDLNQTDIETIGAMIEFFWSNGQIQKRKITKWVNKGVTEWVTKKIL